MSRQISPDDLRTGDVLLWVRIRRKDDGAELPIRSEADLADVDLEQREMAYVGDLAHPYVPGVALLVLVDVRDGRVELATSAPSSKFSLIRRAGDLPLRQALAAHGID